MTSDCDKVRGPFYSPIFCIGEITYQLINSLFQVTKMCCIIQFGELKQKNGDLKLMIWLVTSPKNW